MARQNFKKHWFDRENYEKFLKNTDQGFDNNQIMIVIRYAGINSLMDIYST